MRALLAMLAAVSALTLVVAASGAPASTVQITTCGQTLTTSAALTQNLVCTGTGVVVGAGGITIDLRGFTIRGDGGDYGIDDESGFDRITLKNGVVRNFFLGVTFGLGGTRADNVTVSNLVASGNANRGIDIVGSSAKINSSAVSGSGGYAIYVAGDSASITSSTVSANEDDGIYVWGESARITATSSSGNGGDGIHVFGGSASIKSATALGNSREGIHIEGPSASIQSSTVSGNGYDGIRIDDQMGSAKAASVKSNHADANGFLGGNADDLGLGVYLTNYAKPAVGANTARGNDDAAECDPASLC